MRKKSLNPKATENRRESSRNAARTRRCVEGQIFHEMLSVLPFSNGGASGSANGPGPNALHIDKISVIRISLAYIKLRQILRYHFRNSESNGEPSYESEEDQGKILSRNSKQQGVDAIASPLSTLKLDPYGLIRLGPTWPTLVRDVLKALDCFFMVISAKGNLLYLSDNVEYYLGIPKACLVGHRFIDFVHPCDQREVNEGLAAAALSHNAATHVRPDGTPPKTGSKIEGPKPGENSCVPFRGQMSHKSHRPGLANGGDDLEPPALLLQQLAQPPNVAAIDMVVRLKSLSTLASACTFEPPQQNARLDGPVSPSCLSPDPDTYPVQPRTDGDHSLPDPTHQTHHQLRLNINFLQQQPNHKVMHLYGHAISKVAPRRASAPGELALGQTTQTLNLPHVKARAKPVLGKTKNSALAGSLSPLALRPGGPAEDELSFYIFLVASPVCGTLFDKVTSRSADKVNRNPAPLPHDSAAATVEKPLSLSGYNTVVSRHQMDMKILFFDEIVTDVLGYEIWQMIGRSFYDFIHVLDLDTFRKNVESLHQKGQIETGMYRLLVNNGGYTWVSTQASLVSYPTDASSAFRLADPRCDKQLSHHNLKSDPVKQVVCLHKIVSSKEGQGHILAELQKPHNQSHLWKGISLRTEQILFKNLPASAPPLKNPLPNALTKSSSSINNNNNFKFQANFGSSGLASESISGAALYDGPVLALNISQARVLKRNHGESQPFGSVNNHASASMGKVMVEKDCPALDLYKRAPCLAHEYLNPHTFTKAALKDSFNVHSLQPTNTSHKRRKNVTSVPESMARQTTKNGLKPSIERKNWATDQNCIQIKPRVILPKMAATSRSSVDIVVNPSVKGMIKNSDEDFFTRAPLAGDSCISVDSSILLSPMGLKRKEITKLVHVGDGGVSKPLRINTVANNDVTHKLSYAIPTNALNGHRDDNVTGDDYFDLGQPLDRTDSMENILDDIMSLQEDKGILSFGNETVGHGQEGDVEEIKRALLDNGRDQKAQIVFNNHSLKDRSRVASLGMESKYPPTLPCKTNNPDIMMCHSTTPIHGLNGQFNRHLIAPSHILNSVCTTFSTTHSRPFGLTASPASSQGYQNLLPSLSISRAMTVVPENKVNSLKKRTDTKLVPTRLANGVLANLLRNGEDLSHGYKCFSPYPNTNTTTKFEAEHRPSHLETGNMSSARRNSEPLTTADRLLKRVILKPPSGVAVDVKLESPSPNSSYDSLGAGFDFGSSSTLLNSEHESGGRSHEKSTDFARFQDKMTNGYSHLKYTGDQMVRQKPGPIMSEAYEEPACQNYYLCGFTPDNGEDRALFGDHAYVLEEGIDDNCHLDKGLRCYLGNNLECVTGFDHTVGAAKFLKGLWALPGATTGLLNNGYDCNDELYNLNNGGMNVFEETNILDDV